MNESVKQFADMRDDFMKIQDSLVDKTAKEEENMSLRMVKKYQC